MKRFKGASANTRHSASARVGALSPLLFKLENEPMPVKKNPHNKKGSPATLLTDDQVRECRRLHEKEGWSRPRLVAKYAEFGVTDYYMYRLLDYQTRSKVV